MNNNIITFMLKAHSKLQIRKVIIEEIGEVEEEMVEIEEDVKEDVIKIIDKIIKKKNLRKTKDIMGEDKIDKINR